ncbi:MAG: hypothetical protein ACKN9V_05555, partial [Pseudomonadota bacterium]
NNALVVQTLAQWSALGDSPGQKNRLEIVANELACPFPEENEGSFAPSEMIDQETRPHIKAQLELLDSIDQRERRLHPDQLTEAGLIELENLRRLERDIQREKSLFNGPNNPVLKELYSRKKSVIQKLTELGLSPVLENAQTQTAIAAPKDLPSLSKSELKAFEKSHNLIFDSQTNSFIMGPDSKIDSEVLSLFSRARGIHLRYQGLGREKELFFFNGANPESLVALMAHEAASLGVGHRHTSLSWDEIRKLDNSNAGGDPVPWFPLTEKTSARLIERNGKLEADFISNDILSEETRRKMEALIQARTEAHAAAAQYGKGWEGLRHAARAYGGAIVGYDPSQTSETKRLQSAANNYAALRHAFAAIGIAPIKGMQENTREFNKNELQMMKAYLDQEDEAIHQFLTNVETIHALSEIALTSAIPVGNLLALEAKLAKVAYGSSKAATAARVAQVLVRTAIRYRDATKNGLATAAKFEGVHLLASSLLSLSPDSADKIIEDRIKRATEGGLGDNWRKHPAHPGRDPKWGEFDKKTGQPVNSQLRAEYLKALVEYNVEESLDIDGNGVIDELQGEAGTPVPFARKRDFISKVSDPHRLKGFADSAAFFRNLEMVKGLPARWITLPTEMALASSLQEAARSNESLRWEQKQTGKDPGSLLKRMRDSAISGFVEGGRFGISGTASNATLAKIAGGGPSGFKQLLGTGLFIAIDSATKAAVNQYEYGSTGVARGSWEETLKGFVEDNAVTAYIGWGISRSGLARKQHQDLKKAFLTGGEPALKNAVEQQESAIRENSESVKRQVLSSVNPTELAAAPRATQEAYAAFVESTVLEGNARLVAAQRIALASGETFITSEEALRVGEINHRILELFRGGAWSQPKEIARLMREQDQIFEGITQKLKEAEQGFQKMEMQLRKQAARSDPEIRAAFEANSQALNAHREVIAGLTEAAGRMAPLRLMVGPVETIAAVSDPHSELAKRQFSNRPQALAALERYQKSTGQKFWETLGKWSEKLSEEHLGPDFRRSDSGEGSFVQRVFGDKPSTVGFSGREQRAAAEYVEQVIKDKKTSPQEKEELLGVLFDLDPARANKLAESLFPNTEGP